MRKHLAAVLILLVLGLMVIFLWLTTPLINLVRLLDRKGDYRVENTDPE